VFIYKHYQEISLLSGGIDSVHLVNAFNIISMDEKRKLYVTVLYRCDLTHSYMPGNKTVVGRHRLYMPPDNSLIC